MGNLATYTTKNDCATNIQSHFLLIFESEHYINSNYIAAVSNNATVCNYYYCCCLRRGWEKLAMSGNDRWWYQSHWVTIIKYITNHELLPLFINWIIHGTRAHQVFKKTLMIYYFSENISAYNDMATSYYHNNILLLTDHSHHFRVIQ